MGAPVASTSYVDLTTLEAVKDLLVGVGDSSDSKLSSLITRVSRRMAISMNRFTKLDRRTETIRLRSFRRLVSLRGAPIATVHAVRIGATPGEAAVENPLVSTDDFIIETELAALRMITVPGAIREGDVGRPIFDGGYVLVDYTGGLGADSGEVEENYADIAQACAEQVAALHARIQGGSIGQKTARADGGGSVDYGAAYDWLPSVAEVIQLYKREVMG